MTYEITPDETLNSDDIIERLEDLTDLIEACCDAAVDAADMCNRALYLEARAEGIELQAEQVALQGLADDAEGAPDWTYGETLIREDYFTAYITDLIEDCYEMPKQMQSGEWPYRHMTIDYEAAADEAKADYIEAEYCGHTYLIRA